MRICWLRSSGWTGRTLDQGVAHGQLNLNAGQTIHLVLHRSTLEQTPARIWSEPELAATVDATVAYWRYWSEIHQTYQGPWRS
jgi:alpha,alpha-trehalase